MQYRTRKGPDNPAHATIKLLPFSKGIPRIYPSNDKNGNKSGNTQ